MSGGYKCACPESKKPLKERQWRVMQRMCNHSAFNGGHYTPSLYSSITCMCCPATWRTKAAYVAELADY